MQNPISRFLFHVLPQTLFHAIPHTEARSFLCLPTVVFQQVTPAFQNPDGIQLVVNCYHSLLQRNTAIQHAVDSVLVS